jgi:hypothetical protein
MFIYNFIQLYYYNLRYYKVNVFLGRSRIASPRNPTKNVSNLLPPTLYLPTESNDLWQLRRTQSDQLLKSSVKASTEKSYLKGFSLWQDFLSTQEDTPDPWLLDVPDDSHKQILLGSFLTHLSVNQRRSSTGIDCILAAIKFTFVRNFLDVRFMESSTFLNMKKGLNNINSQLHQIQPKLPFSRDLLEIMILEASPDDKSVEMTILSITLMFHFAWRVSNVVSSLGSGSVDHSLKFSSVHLKLIGSSHLIGFPWDLSRRETLIWSTVSI